MSQYKDRLRVKMSEDVIPEAATCWGLPQADPSTLLTDLCWMLLMMISFQAALTKWFAGVILWEEGSPSTGHVAVFKQHQPAYKQKTSQEQAVPALKCSCSVQAELCSPCPH